MTIKKGVIKRLSPEVEAIMFESSSPYITGAGYRSLCDFKFDDYESFNVDLIEQFDGMKIFVKTDMIITFALQLLPKIEKNFILYTHNSDLAIVPDPQLLEILNNSKLTEWNAQNVCFKHNKLKSIPIGISNKMWKIGNTDVFEDIKSSKEVLKDNMVYCNFDLNTNGQERVKCLNEINLTMSPKVNHDEYIKNISKSYFVISPDGNGVDCHRHWEALYVKTIPIVTNSITIENFSDFPFLVLDRWEDFKNITLSEELYNEIWSEFNEEKLHLKL